MGWDVPTEICARAAEADDRSFLADVFRRRGVTDGDVEGWVRRKQELTVSSLRDAPPVFPGVSELVARLRGLGKRLAVVSGTWRENVEAVLNASGLASAFEEIVGKEDVPRTKPDPAPYREALSRLGLQASGAVALEDSPSGLDSARAAGLRCVAVGHRRPPGEWAGGFEYVADLRDTEAVLTALGVRPKQP